MSDIINSFLSHKEIKMATQRPQLWTNGCLTVKLSEESCIEELYTVSTVSLSVLSAIK